MVWKQSCIQLNSIYSSSFTLIAEKPSDIEQTVLPTLCRVPYLVMTDLTWRNHSNKWSKIIYPIYWTFHSTNSYLYMRYLISKTTNYLRILWIQFVAITERSSKLLDYRRQTSCAAALFDVVLFALGAIVSYFPSFILALSCFCSPPHILWIIFLEYFIILSYRLVYCCCWWFNIACRTVHGFFCSHTAISKWWNVCRFTNYTRFFRNFSWLLSHSQMVSKTGNIVRKIPPSISSVLFFWVVVQKQPFWKNRKYMLPLHPPRSFAKSQLSLLFVPYLQQ